MGLLGIDVGTSGVKVIIVDDSGEVLAKVSKEYPVYYPKPMWSEQNPDDWWEAACSGISEAMYVSGLKPSDIAGIGLSGQMVGLVVLDREYRVIRPCILWNDQRSAEEATRLTQNIGLENILEETGNPLFASFVAPKLVWMRNNEPELYGKIRHVMMPKDYIIFRLTGSISTEVSDASGTCLFNVKERKWSKTMINYMNVPLEWLPDCSESDEIVGRVTCEAAAKAGLIEGIPVVAGAGDQAAQALGCGIVKPGLCSVTIGTSGVVFTQSDKFVRHPEGLLHSFCHSARGQWYLMGVMLSAGGSYQWLRNLLKETSTVSYKFMDEMASKASPGCEGLIFLPYLAGERCPYDDPYARGGWIGLSQRHSMSHVIRSVMEGITFGLFDSINLIKNLGTDVRSVYVSGGAANSELWLHMIADVFNTEVIVTNAVEGAAYGAAMLAGIGTGKFYNAAQAAEALIKVTGRVEPQKEFTNVYHEAYGIYRSLYPKLKDSFADITSFSSGIIN